MMQPGRIACVFAALTLVSAPCWGAEFAEQAGRLDEPAVMDAVIKAGDAAVADLCAALQGPRPDLAAHALGAIKSKAALPALLTLAATKDDELRATTAWAIGQCGGNDAGAALATLAADRYPPVRVAAVIGLTNVRSPEGDAALRAATTDALEAVRMAAADAIRRGKRNDLFGSLAAMLEYTVERVPEKTAEGAKKPADNEKPKLVDQVNWKEPSARVRLAAIRALGESKATDAAPALIYALEREDSYNRQTILKAIEDMGPPVAGVCLGHIVPMPYDKEAFEAHLPTLISNGSLAVIAGRLGDSRCVPTLLNTLKLPHKELGKDTDLTELFIQTVELLGKFKSERAGRPLAELLKETTIRQLSDAAQQSIREIGRAAARPLAHNMDEWSLAPIFLKLLREPALRTAEARKGIVAFLTHESDEVRLEATETLGLYIHEGILDEYDIPLLESMYLDPYSGVRAASRRWQDLITQKLESARSGGSGQ